VTLQGNALSVSLTVKDLEQSLHWYHDVIGFTVNEKHEREGKLVAVSLQAGNARLLINQDNGVKGWDRAKGEGFSMMITTDQKIDDIAKGIVDAGGTLATEPADMPWGARMFRVRDPDGFLLTIASERAPRAQA
jgi:uncharacterized glyoxalase superfamily protein PhnB